MRDAIQSEKRIDEPKGPFRPVEGMILDAPDRDQEPVAVRQGVHAPHRPVVHDAHLAVTAREAPRVDRSQHDGMIEQAVDDDRRGRAKYVNRSVTQRSVGPLERRGPRIPRRRPQRDESPIVLLDDIDDALGTHCNVAHRPDARELDGPCCLESSADAPVAGHFARELSDDEHFAVLAHGKSGGGFRSRESGHLVHRRVELDERALAAEDPDPLGRVGQAPHRVRIRAEGGLRGRGVGEVRSRPPDVLPLPERRQRIRHGRRGVANAGPPGVDMRPQPARRSRAARRRPQGDEQRNRGEREALTSRRDCRCCRCCCPHCFLRRRC